MYNGIKKKSILSTSNHYSRGFMLPLSSEIATKRKHFRKKIL